MLGGKVFGGREGVGVGRVLRGREGVEREGGC